VSQINRIGLNVHGSMHAVGKHVAKLKVQKSLYTVYGFPCWPCFVCDFAYNSEVYFTIETTVVVRYDCSIQLWGLYFLSVLFSAKQRQFWRVPCKMSWDYWALCLRKPCSLNEAVGGMPGVIIGGVFFRFRMSRDSKLKLLCRQNCVDNHGTNWFRCRNNVIAVNVKSPLQPASRIRRWVLLAMLKSRGLQLRSV